MSEPYQVLEGSIQITGSLEILGDVVSGSIQSNATKLEAIHGSIQTIKGWSDAFILSIVKDSMVSVSEKRELLRRWREIETEYPIIRNRALGVGMLVTDSKIVDYDEAFAALKSYLWSEPGILADMTVATDIDAQEFVAKWADYIGTREALTSEVNFLTYDLADSVRLGNIIDGAIARAKLEAGFLSEFEQTKSEVFPLGLQATSDLAMIKPQWQEANALADQLMSIVADTEEGLHANLMETSTLGTKYASLKFDVDGFSSIVGELINGGAGQTVDLTAITQTKANINLMASEGRVIDYDAEGHPVIDTYALAQIDILSDKISLVVEAAVGGGYQLSSLIVTPESIASEVSSVMKNDEDVLSTVARLVQESDAVRISVQENLERGDEILKAAQAGILVNSHMIQLEAQKRSEQGETLYGRITVTAEEIRSEIGAIGSDIGTQITQTRDAINLAVWGSSTPGATISDLQSQISMHAGSIGMLAEGVGGSAFFGMSVSLPVFATPAQISTMVNTAGVGEALVAAVYAPSTNGYYFVKESATAAQVSALRIACAAARLLRSKITMSASEILLGGKVYATDIELSTITVLDHLVVGPGNVAGLGFKALAYKDDLSWTEITGKPSLGALAYKDAVEMAELGSTLIVGGHLITDLIDVDTLFAQAIAIRTGGHIRGGSYDGNGTKAAGKGFWIDAAGNMKATSAEFTDCNVSGNLIAGNLSILDLTCVGTITAGDYVVRRSSAYVSTINTTPTVLHELRIAAGGTVRVTFTCGHSGLPGMGARIYVNSTAVGTTRTDGGTYAQDISVSEGDYVRICAWCTEDGSVSVSDVFLGINREPGLLKYLG